MSENADTSEPRFVIVNCGQGIWYVLDTVTYTRGSTFRSRRAAEASAKELSDQFDGTKQG